MEFAKTYFEDEIREGFYIPGMIKRSWATQIDILNQVAKVCEKHDIKWFAGYGTLLGAVRHQGFIPWDDDLDICMLQDDYNRFLSYAERELPGSYRIVNIHTRKEYANFISRVVNQDRINTTSEYMEKHFGFPYASGIDVFPLNYLFLDEDKEEERRVRAEKVWRLIEEGNDKPKEAELLIRRVEEATGYKVDRSLPVENALYRVVDKVFFEAPKEGAEYVTLMPVWAIYKGQKIPISSFENTIDIPFENTKIKVPVEYEKILRIVYGDWEKANRHGGLHNYPFYIEMEKELEKRSGGTIAYKYYYDKEKESKDSNEIKDDLLKIISMLYKVDEMLRNLLIAGNSEPVFSLLEGSQDMAIKIGTQLENSYGDESNKAVSFLEEYCETLFLLNEALEENDLKIAIEHSNKLDSFIYKVKSTYLDELRKQNEVLFVVYKPRMWKYLETIYEDRKNKGFRVKVLTIPYYDKNATGNITDKEHYEKEGYPDDVELMDYNEYSFSKYSPREIVIQSPFDQYESAISVHPFFYSKNLKKFTDKLTYVQSFSIDDIAEDDEKGLKNAKTCIISPGVINADEIYVQSERMKDIFINFLSETTGEEKENLENRIIVNQVKREENDLMNDNSQEKKTVLFYPSFASIYENKENIIKKLENIINIFKENRDGIKTIWIEDDYLSDELKKYCTDIYDDYIQIKKQFSENIGEIIVISEDLEEIIKKGDAFYGSGGYIMNLAIRKRIPAMLWNVND